MNHLVFCNIGARDVQLWEGETLTEVRPPRSQGQRVLEEYHAYAEKIALPLLQPGLDFILQFIGKEPCQLVLLGTDQKTGKFLETDTLFFAWIAEKRLEEIYPGRFSVTVQLLERINPALYDETFEYFGGLLPQYFLPHPGQCFVILAGGTPACNTALLLQGVRLFGRHLQAVYVPPGREPLLLRVGYQIESTLKEAAAIDHLQRLDFDGALSVLEQIQVDPGLIKLVRCAAQRFAFDFPSARLSLQEAIRDGSPAVREFCGTLLHELDVLPTQEDENGDLLALLEELHWNARITFQHRRYADFLGRVYRFQEALLRYLIEQIFHLSTDLAPTLRDENQRRWEETIAQNQPLLNFLETRQVDGEPLNWRSIARPVYKAMLSYALDENPKGDPQDRTLISPSERGYFKSLLGQVNALDRMVEYRHRTIIGHGFKGVSLEEILAVSPGEKSPDLVLAEIMRVVRKKKRDECAFHAIARFACQELKKES